jgi:malonyl-CoA/methylmalonyl-CoA synthetase
VHFYAALPLEGVFLGVASLPVDFPGCSLLISIRRATIVSLRSRSDTTTRSLRRYSSDGYYTITGRARELIISGGYNIYPREVEDVLALHPAVAEVAVLGLPDVEMGEKVVAAIVRKVDQSAEPSEIIAFCRERLASYKKPRQVVFVDALPRNALGKVQKHILAAQIA